MYIYLDPPEKSIRSMVWGDMFLRVLGPNVSKIHDITGYIPVIFPYHIISIKNHHYIRCVFL